MQVLAFFLPLHFEDETSGYDTGYWRKRFLHLDSGAHTFQKEGNSTDYDRFVREYAQYVKNNPWIDEYVELDIEAKVGIPQVEKWRQEMTEIVGKPQS